jgi:hypothetical protein
MLLTIDVFSAFQERRDMMLVKISQVAQTMLSALRKQTSSVTTITRVCLVFQEVLTITIAKTSLLAQLKMIAK